jgi:hypothetical protein
MVGFPAMSAFSGSGSARLRRLFALASLAALVGACGSSPRYVRTADRDHPRVRYADGLVSLNDRCIISGAKLNLRMTPTYVNGFPVGYC